MTLKFYKLVLAITVATFISSCSDDDNGSSSKVTESQVVEAYANHVYQSYSNALNDAKSMQDAINSFINNPTEVGFENAKSSWLYARESYGLTEAFRECQGPVDFGGESWSLENEGQMNAWPIDESYIDYVSDGTEAFAGTNVGIIQNTSIVIKAETIKGMNEGAGADDKAISSGWHAIEFLLWGQDNTLPTENLPGQRSYLDYVNKDEFVARRKQYLQIATEVLIADLTDLMTTWSPNGAYRNVYESQSNTVNLKNFLYGAWFIAGDELASERLIAPVDSTDGINNSGQEDEHSCFADNTHRDVYANAKGVYDVVFGNYAGGNGASFYDLVKQADASVAASLLSAGDAAMNKVNIVVDNEKPFDWLITLETSANPGIIMEAVRALEDFSDAISEAASAISINIVE